MRIGNLIISLLLCCLGCFGATYYVSTSGNDSTGNGSFGSPWRTINKGLTSMSGGDTLLIRGGTYEEANITSALLKDGTPANPTRIASYTGERAVFRPNASNNHGISSASNRAGPTNMVFDGWTVDFSLKTPSLTSLACVKLYSAANITFTNMHFVNNTNGSLLQVYASGVGGSETAVGSGILVTSCLFSNVYNVDIEGQELVASHAIYTYPATGMVIEKSTFRNGHSTAILLGTDSGDNIATNVTVRFNDVATFNHGIYLSQSRGALVHNNMVRHLNQSTIYGTGIHVTGTGNTIANNSILGGYFGVRLNNMPNGTTSSGNVFANNIAHQPTYRGLYISSSVGASAWTNNIAPNTSGDWSGATTSGQLIGDYDPLFSNISTPPYSLSLSSTNSPAFNAGVNLSSLFTTDFYGTSRPQYGAWDIGAHEYAEDEEELPVEPVLGTRSTLRGKNNLGGRTR